MTEISKQGMHRRDRAQATEIVLRTKARPAIGAVHRALRSVTREDHASIDRMLLPFDLSRPDHYGIFLNVHFTVLAALQGSWRVKDAQDFERMLECVKADLQALGHPTVVSSIQEGAPVSVAAGLGIGYVVRGSRLGAAVLRGDVTGELPTSYLDFVPTHSWAAFLAELESIADDLQGRDEAARGARSTFTTFAAEFMRTRDLIANS